MERHHRLGHEAAFLPASRVSPPFCLLGTGRGCWGVAAHGRMAPEAGRAPIQLLLPGDKFPLPLGCDCSRDRVAQGPPPILRAAPRPPRPVSRSSLSQFEMDLLHVRLKGS